MIGSAHFVPLRREQLTADVHPIYAVSMPFRCGKWLVVLTLVLATGTHWFFLQSIAWVGMTIKFSRTESLTGALIKTFDGQHPCNLCKAVSEGVKTEKAQKLQKLETKLDFFCSSKVSLLEVALPEALPTYTCAVPHGRLDAPPIPPPRFA